MFRCLVALVLAVPLVSGRAAAQRGLVPLDSATVAALASLQARIDTAPELRLRTLWGTSILVAPRLVPSGIEYHDLTGEAPRIDGREFFLQRRGHATGTGAVVGGLLLGALGTGLGVFLIGFSCIDAERPCSPPRGVPVAFGFLGIVAGASMGALIGSGITRWHTIYRHPDPIP